MFLFPPIWFFPFQKRQAPWQTLLFGKAPCLRSVFDVDFVVCRFSPHP